MRARKRVHEGARLGRGEQKMGLRIGGGEYERKGGRSSIAVSFPSRTFLETPEMLSL